MKKKGNLRPAERDRIAYMLAKDKSIGCIARTLGRSKSTISDEIQRNKRWSTEKNNWVYEAFFAQEETTIRMSERRRRPRLKNSWIYDYVCKYLRGGWSPEQIEGRLKLKYENVYEKNIGHEAIYQYVFDMKEQKDEQNGGLWEYLARKQTKRKRQQGRGVHKSHIPHRVSIHTRPEAVEKRDELGHFEGDSIEGRRSVGDGFHTEVERLSRMTFAVKVDKISSEEGIRAQRKIFANLPAYARLSTTLDNGKENHLHYMLRTELNMDTYMADPYSSWQRGTNENTNGLIRRYFPKKTDLTKVTQEELDEVVWELNNRPRKVLGYYTPLEVFTRELAKRSDSR